MEDKISRSTFVVNFFKPNLGDKQLERSVCEDQTREQSNTHCECVYTLLRLRPPVVDGEALVLSVCPLELPGGWCRYSTWAQFDSCIKIYGLNDIQGVGLRNT